MRTRKVFFFVLLLASISNQCLATKFVVAPAGGNFTTIQTGVNAAFAGDTVLVKAGTYNEAVSFPRSGSLAGGYITLLGETGAILDGTGRGQLGTYINNRNYIRVQGIEVRNFRGTGTPIGISVEGSSNHLEIRNNLVHNIENANGNAHGIAFYGTSTTAISSILVDGNEIRNCLLGQSESLVLNGNVTNFIVSNNTVHDNDNIGIDFIGFEGVGPTGADQARNGICVDNIVYNISTFTNPTYGGDRNADGIYVDGGLNITIERNLVYNCDIGIELASEHAGKNTQDIRVRNNFVYGSYQANIMAGGYAANRGNSVYISIVNNTTYQGNQGEIALQFNCDNITIKNNICYAKAGQEYLQEWGNNNTNITVNNNLYFGQSTTSPGAWPDANARYINPGLVAAPTNLHLSATSPARDAGINLGSVSGLTVSGDYDKDFQSRIMNGTIDIGADEFFVSLPINLLSFTATPFHNNYVSLQWQTISEINNNYFEVQRCTDIGSNAWSTLYKVNGSGNSNDLHSYEYKDFPATGNVYYRLKQVDNDEQYTYSKVITVHLSLPSGVQNIYPNPASTNLQVRIESTSADILSYKIYDMPGRELIRGEQPLSPGNNQIIIDVSELPQGNYIIQLTNSKEAIASMFLKE